MMLLLFKRSNFNWLKVKSSISLSDLIHLQININERSKSGFSFTVDLKLQAVGIILIEQQNEKSTFFDTL